MWFSSLWSTASPKPSSVGATSTSTAPTYSRLNEWRAKLQFPHALMSHRGGSLERVENTLPAFRFSANVLKVDLLELDVYMTKDGHPVVFHDSDLGRLCGIPDKKISQYNYKDLPPLLIPEKLKDVTEVIEDPESRRIPLLKELLDEFPKYPMQIDVKEGSEEMVIKVGNLIRAYSRESQTVWGSFHSAPCNQPGYDPAQYASYYQAYAAYSQGTQSVAPPGPAPPPGIGLPPASYASVASMPPPGLAPNHPPTHAPPPGLTGPPPSPAPVAPSSVAPTVDTSTPEYAAWYAQWQAYQKAAAAAAQKPAYIPVKSQQPPAASSSAAFSAASQKTEEASPAKKTGWPDSLKKYVTKVFAACSAENRDAVEKQLKELIGAITAKNALYDTNWDKMPLPIQCVNLDKASSTTNSKSALTANGSSPSSPALSSKKRRKGAGINLDEVPDQGVGDGPEEDDPMAGLSHLPPHLRQEELARREARASRFKQAQEEEREKQRIRKKQNDKARELALAMGPDNTDVIDWDEFTIVGVCTKLEKNYLRLTSAPDPSTVRPLHILKQTLDMLLKKWKKEANYPYICDQFKSLRQDLTVQRIRNDFTVRAYECHARIALEKGDVGEYNQCQAQLKELYRLGLPGCTDEFLGYRILYMIYTLNRTDLVNILAELTDEEKKGTGVSHALTVRTAVAIGDYHSLFTAYLNSPNMSNYLMDFFIERERYKALRAICRSYRPYIGVDFVARELGWVHPADSEDLAREQTGKCREWLSEIGTPFTDAELSMIDTKAATPFFVSKVNVVMQKGVDIKGQLNN
ncbi:hypothetical protein HDV05_003313 [Chytridiales sp. JEL 0842]|nr:hypothetical protein HDV05_003313 [Chytridiales sp. JEL 0842]